MQTRKGVWFLSCWVWISRWFGPPSSTRVLLLSLRLVSGLFSGLVKLGLPSGHLFFSLLGPDLLTDVGTDHDEGWLFELFFFF